MRKIREVLRLRLEADLCSPNQHLYQVSVGSIQKLLKSAQALALPGPLPTEFDDGTTGCPCSIRRPIPPSRPAMLCRIGPLSIRSSKRRVLQTAVWEEYTQRYPNSCYSYSQFCDRYKSWCQLQSAPCARSTRRGKLFIDYCGPRCPSCRRLRVRSVRHKSLSPCSVRPTTPLPRPPGPPVTAGLAAKPCPCL